MTAEGTQTQPPGWHGQPIEELPWAVLIRVAVCRGVACMLITLLAAAFIPRPFGFTGTTIVTGSMMPSIQPGDVALVQAIDEYGLGQVILFPNPARPEQLIIHRIWEIRPDGMLVTKGDANADPDSTPVDPETVIGVGRILVPAIGLPIVWGATGNFLLVIATVLLTALLLRGMLRIEFFPGVRKGEVGRAVIESAAVLAMLGMAAVVVTVGVARSAHAAFIDLSSAEASWAMATAPPQTPPCSITRWRAQIIYLGDNARVEGTVESHQSTAQIAPGRSPGTSWRTERAARDSDLRPIGDPGGERGRGVVGELGVPSAGGRVSNFRFTMDSEPTSTYLSRGRLLNGSACGFRPAANHLRDRPSRCSAFRGPARPVNRRSEARSLLGHTERAPPR